MSKAFYHRNLPHWHPPGRLIFLTWSLNGSLPQNVIDQLKVIRRQLSNRKAVTNTAWTTDKQLLEYKRLFVRVDAILDKAGTGPLWLKNVEIASLVEQSLLKKYAHLYSLWSYVVMANHVHTFLRPNPQVTLGSITKHLKGYTAREANRLLQRTGQPFWQDESFDHWCRDRAEFFRIIAYIENNPVKAGLVERPEDWPWSSAAERKRRGLNEIAPLT